MNAQETKAVKACARWLSECIRLGWKKSDLDALEALWWKYYTKREGQKTKS